MKKAISNLPAGLPAGKLWRAGKPLASFFKDRKTLTLIVILVLLLIPLLAAFLWGKEVVSQWLSGLGLSAILVALLGELVKSLLQVTPPPPPDLSLSPDDILLMNILEVLAQHGAFLEHCSFLDGKIWEKEVRSRVPSLSDHDFEASFHQHRDQAHDYWRNVAGDFWAMTKTGNKKWDELKARNLSLSVIRK